MKNVATMSKCAITIRQVRLRRSADVKYSSGWFSCINWVTLARFT